MVGRKGIQVLVLGAHYSNFLLWNTPGSDNAVTVAESDVIGTKNYHLYALPSYQLAPKDLVA